MFQPSECVMENGAKRTRVAPPENMYLEREQTQFLDTLLQIDIPLKKFA